MKFEDLKFTKRELEIGTITMQRCYELMGLSIRFKPIGWMPLTELKRILDYQASEEYLKGIKK